jgi:hypothetical protein
MSGGRAVESCFEPVSKEHNHSCLNVNMLHCNKARESLIFRTKTPCEDL